MCAWLAKPQGICVPSTNTCGANGTGALGDEQCAVTVAVTVTDPSPSAEAIAAAAADADAVAIAAAVFPAASTIVSWASVVCTMVLPAAGDEHRTEHRAGEVPADCHLSHRSAAGDEQRTEHRTGEVPADCHLSMIGKPALCGLNVLGGGLKARPSRTLSTQAFQVGIAFCAMSKQRSGKDSCLQPNV